MSRVALLGGSFNPPHIGHQMLALWALGGGWVDEVWLLPCGQHAFGKTLAPFPRRVAMCEAMLAPFDRGKVSVCAIEGEFEGPSRTFATLQVLSERHPEVRFSLLMGADLLEEIPRWYRAEALLEQVSLLVAGRPGASVEEMTLFHDVRHRVFRDVQFLAVSSSEIRRRLAQGGDVAALVPRAVLDIIAREGLYSHET